LVRRRISLFSRSSESVEQSRRQCSFGNAVVEGEQVQRDLLQERGGLGESLLELVDDAAVLHDADR
jgi:hypothetical protein